MTRKELAEKALNILTQGGMEFQEFARICKELEISGVMNELVKKLEEIASGEEK